MSIYMRKFLTSIPSEEENISSAPVGPIKNFQQDHWDQFHNLSDSMKKNDPAVRIDPVGPQNDPDRQVPLPEPVTGGEDSDLYKVYILCEPWDMKMGSLGRPVVLDARYVGVTSKPAHRRFAGHLREARDAFLRVSRRHRLSSEDPEQIYPFMRRKDAWIQRLLLDNQKPRIFVMDLYKSPMATSIGEDDWILKVAKIVGPERMLNEHRGGYKMKGRSF